MTTSDNTLDTISDPYFISAAAGLETPSGRLLVHPIEDGPWEEWISCGQVPGEADDKLYKSKWYRKGRIGTLVQLGDTE